MIWTIISHFTAQPINCVSQSIVSMFRVLGIFNFACTIMKAVRVDEKKCWVSDGTIFFNNQKMRNCLDNFLAKEANQNHMDMPYIKWQNSFYNHKWQFFSDIKFRKSRKKGFGSGV